MNLKEAFAQWYTYAPTIFGNDKLDEPFTVQYRLVSKGEAQRIENLSEEEVEKEVETWPAIKQHLGDEWERFNLGVKRDLLLFARCIGHVENLADGDRNLTDIFEVFAVLSGVLGGRLMRELNLCIIGVQQEDKKNSAR